MNKMRAAVHRRYGPPSVVTIEEVDRPTMRAADILIRIEATTVNRTDCGYRAASPIIIRLITGLRAPRRTILGTEYAGVVVGVGPSVTRFQKGQRVFGYNEGHFGAHAEYVAVPETAAVAVMAEGVDFATAAASTEGSHYALVSIRKSGLGEGDAALINGASGAIGSAAVQLAKNLGANVTAVCGTAQVEAVRALGADRVIDYNKTDFTGVHQQYDLVFDAVGKTSFKRSKHLLKDGGVYAWSEAGPYAQNFLLVPLTHLFGKRRVIFAYPTFDQEMIEYLGSLVGNGSFSPLIDRTYPLEKIVEAYQYVETGQKAGNVIISTER